jgi:hypothetical protein
VYPGNQFEYHLKPFKAAIAAGAAQMMPYYGMQVGTLYEEMGFAFNRALITGLLREDLGFQGIICTDWELVTQKVIMGQLMPARALGLEHLSRSARIQRIMEAGYDQLGGESCPELLSELVTSGQVTEKRLDQSVRRLLREKFQLGLSDDPFVDEDAAEEIVGNEEFCKLGAEVQRRSYTLLTNTDNCLPLRPNLHQTAKIYVEGIPTGTVQTYGHQVVEDPTDADIALLRLKTPYEPRPGGFESLFHAGSLEFNEEEKAHQAKIFDAVPTVIVDIYADRPPVVPEVIQRASADFCPMEAPLTLSWTSFSGSVSQRVDCLLISLRPWKQFSSRCRILLMIPATPCFGLVTVFGIALDNTSSSVPDSGYNNVSFSIDWRPTRTRDMHDTPFVHYRNYLRLAGNFTRCSIAGTLLLFPLPNFNLNSSDRW